MQTYHLKLESAVNDSYRCQRAADSLDIDVKKKSVHEISVVADLAGAFSVGLIVGASGSGKTTLAKSIFGMDCFDAKINVEEPIINQLPAKLTYDECASILAGIGLTSVPCWIRPVKTLSNGQRARAEAALAMTRENERVLIDEWTSVVDRTVAKVMSHCVQKFARRNKKQIVLLSCHYDVIEWLDPDWVIDCNTQKFIDRRLLQPDERKRTERLEFEIKRVDRSSWKYFSKYHYLSDRLPGGELHTFGLFHGPDQIGFQCFANYVPTRKNTTPIFHSNRTVIHPDYAGMGLGILVINETSALMKRTGVRVMAKFSSTPIYRSMIKNPKWRLKSLDRTIGKTKVGGNMGRQHGFRENLKIYSFEFVGD
jgi:ABC-type lipoprotein export system ATPase subunit